MKNIKFLTMFLGIFLILNTNQCLLAMKKKPSQSPSSEDSKDHSQESNVTILTQQEYLASLDRNNTRKALSITKKGVVELVQIPSLQQMHSILSNFIFTHNEQQKSYGKESYKLLCPIYSLYFATRFLELARENKLDKQSLVAAMNDRIQFNNFLGNAIDITGSIENCINMKGSDIFSLAQKMITIPKELNQFNVHPSCGSKESWHKQLDCLKETEGHGYLVFIINTEPSEKTGYHWLTLFIHKDNKDIKFMLANSLSGDHSELETLKPFLDKFSTRKKVRSENTHEVDGENDAATAA